MRILEIFLPEKNLTPNQNNIVYNHFEHVINYNIRGYKRVVIIV